MSCTNDPSIPRHLSTIYADDLRQEIDGKITIVGMYQCQMLVPAFPITIPKLAILMTGVTPVDCPFTKGKFILLKDTEVMQSIDFDVTEKDFAFSADIENGNRVMQMQFATFVSPLQLDGPCVLRTRLETDEGVIAGRALVVSQLPANSSIH